MTLTREQYIQDIKDGARANGEDGPGSYVRLLLELIGELETELRIFKTENAQLRSVNARHRKKESKRRQFRGRV